MYSKTVRKTLPFLGRCLLFAILCCNFINFLPYEPPFFTQREFALIAALVISFLPMRVSSFVFLTIAELAAFYLIYDLFYAISAVAQFSELFLKITLHGGVAPILCGLYLILGILLAKRIVTTSYTVSVHHEIPDGRIRILQLSDIHPGRVQTKFGIRRLYRLAEKAKPDMIVLTGDIFDEFTRPSKFRMYCDIFAQMNPRYGIWYVYGNHDADWHWHRPDHTREDIRRHFTKAGIHVLEDECEVICGGKVRICGRRDINEPRLSPDELLSDDFDGLTVLLCHEPVELKQCAEAGADITFAGHTHGGQIFPLGLLTNRVLKLNEMNSGIDEVSPKHYAVVSSGVGTWAYPIRTEGKSELVVVDIVKS